MNKINKQPKVKSTLQFSSKSLFTASPSQTMASLHPSRLAGRFSRSMNKYIPVIGLEVHIELATLSKMFCGCPSDHFAKKPNTQTCPVCLGLPGALPVPNRKAIDWCIMLGIAYGCKINQYSNFDRKHYFYPDLPKGYQISQYDDPFCYQGKYKQFRIRRIHMEEDTAKLIHTEINGKQVSLIDFNRSGVPLVELVTEPDFSNENDVLIFLHDLQRVVRYLGISEADMEKGSMRLEANVSITTDKSIPNYKVELKNINSFKFLKKAILSEIERQTSILQKGSKVVQETRGWNESKGQTFSLRIKEEAKDYRYFPDPDIPPIEISKEQLKVIKKYFPELPQAAKLRLINNCGLSEYQAGILIEDKSKLNIFDKLLQLDNKNHIGPKNIANILINKFDIFSDKSPEIILKKIIDLTKKEYSSDNDTKKAVSRIIEMESKIVSDYKNGKTQVIGYLIGQTQKLLLGKGNPVLISSLLKKYMED